MPSSHIKSIRDGFGEGFAKLGAEDKSVLALTADLGESVRMADFAKEFPERFIQVGIAEQNMAAVAAGLALEGFTPFIGSFAAFQPMRNLDQIRTSIAMMNANVKIVSSHAGFSYGADGMQVQALEDVGIMRMLPNLTVMVPADADQAAEMAKLAANVAGPVYLRLGREKTQLLGTYPDVNKDELKTKVGQAQLLRIGGDVAFIACGYMVGQCLTAAEQLASDGVHATVINMHTIKPFDRDAILDAARHVGKIITVEEHQVTGGLGSAVAEVLMNEQVHAKFASIGVQDRFGDTAKTTQELWEEYGLGVGNIVKIAKSIV